MQAKFQGQVWLEKSKLLDSFRRNFSSRLGTGDDELTAALVKVSKGGEAGIIRAEGVASDLNKVVVNEYANNPKIVSTINDALEGDDVALNSLKP